MLAAATADQPESLFGHLLLHVRYRDDQRVHTQGFEPVYQFGALTDEDVDPEEYLETLLRKGMRLSDAARVASTYAEQTRSELYDVGLDMQDGLEEEEERDSE
jgi:hypothetical protein